MSQLVLARKYRPQNFAQMVGQDHVVQALTNALRTGRLHHAFMFTGTRGVGKTTVSRILAKSLNCVGLDGMGGITDQPCGKCQACTDIDLGRFVDYTELDAASNRGVDEVQSLLEQAVYKPVQGRFKVFMIDEVHMLTGHAFNAMLKTLEEPPEYLKFVLATTDPQKVPVTVLSRCLQFNLRPMAPPTVMEHLAQVMAAEGLLADEAALSLLAKGARGSMRDALSLLDQAIAYGGVAQGVGLSEATVRQMVSAADTGQVVALLDHLAQQDGPALVAQCDQLRTNGLSAAACLDELTAVLQRIAVVQATGRLAKTVVDADQTALLDLAQRLPTDVVHLLYSLVLQGRGDLALAPDEHDALLMVMLRALVFMPGGLPNRSDRAKEPAQKPAIEPVKEPVKETVKQAVPVPSAQPVKVAVPTQSNPATEPPWATQSGTTPQVRQLVVRTPPEPSAKTDSLKAPEDRVKGLDRPNMVVTDLGDQWFDLVKELVRRELVSALVRELALQSQWVGREVTDDGQAPQQWQLRVERESLSQNSHRDRLETALAAIGQNVKIVIELGPVSDSPAKRLAARQAEVAARAIQVVEEDEFVQQMVAQFGAKILRDTISVQAPQ